MNQDIMELAQQLGHLLDNKKYQVTTAESCTGGGVSAAITEIAGSSAWFSASFITYSNKMKQKILKVPASMLISDGAVSEVVTSAMVRGAISLSGADIGVAISGIAGPTGAVPGKPVGTVCFAVGTASKMQTYVEYFQGNRSQVRELAVMKALQILIEFCRAEQKQINN